MKQELNHVLWSAVHAVPQVTQTANGVLARGDEGSQEPPTQTTLCADLHGAVQSALTGLAMMSV